MATWTGPWRVFGAHHKHVFEIQNIVTGRVQTAHVARLRFYADSQLNVAADVKDVFQHAYSQGQFQMAQAGERCKVVRTVCVTTTHSKRTGMYSQRVLKTILQR